MSHEFCRSMLRDVMVEVRKHFTPDEIKASWAWSDGTRNGNYEFHGPNNEYLYNLRMVDCLWSIKAAGWQTLLDRKLEPDVCLAGAPAVNGHCGDPDCVCAPAGRYQIRVIADEHCTSVHDEVLAASDDLAAAKDLASEHSNWPYGSAIVDTVTGSIDYGDTADDAGRTAIGNTPTCEACGQPQDHCTCEETR